MTKKQAKLNKEQSNYAYNKERQRRKELYQKKEWYTVRSLLGNNWAFFFILLGARERGKSYSVMKYCLTQWKLYQKPFTWLKLSEASTKKMLSNNAAQFIDPDLVRNFDLKLTARGTTVFDNGKPMANLLALSTAHNDKGVALFDNENDLGFNIVLDEFQLEKNQRRTFDICYNLVVQLENLVRSRKDKVRIFFIGNSTEEASDILTMFNFIPQEFGIYKLKSKKCIIDYMPNSEAYMERRRGSVGDILAGTTSNFTNKIETDTSLVYKGRLESPQYIIKFSKDKKDWFTVWNKNIVSRYNGENKKAIPMRRYLDELYNIDLITTVFAQNDARAYKFKDLMTQKVFNYQLSLIKKQ